MNNFEIGQYYNAETGRYQWAVFCNQSCTWYFAKNYGKKSAIALCNRLNKEVN